MNASGLSVRTWNDAPITRRDSDGFADATAMCRANSKEWSNYRQNERTTDYIAALAASLGIPADQLVITTTTGPNHLRGTWVHPRLAVDLARWLSPQFAVWMDGWFLEQLGQPATVQAPVLHSEAWRTDVDAFFAQPLPMRAAHYLLIDAESGGTEAIDLIRNRNRRSVAALPGTQGHRIRSLDDLAPSGKAIIQTICRLRACSQPVRTSDLRRELCCMFSPDTIANRLGLLRRTAC